MATVYDIIKGINQAAANAYDGSDAEVGLSREEGKNKRSRMRQKEQEQEKEAG